MSTPENPFASPPEIDDDAVVKEVSEEERIRRAYINFEVSVQAIGSLYYLGGLLCGLAAGGSGAAAIEHAGRAESGSLAGFAALYGFLAVVSIIIGRGLRTLSPWAKVPVGITALIGMLGIAMLGGLIAVLIVALVIIYVLYPVFSKTGAFVFSPEYREIIRRTPHVRYKSYFMWVVLAVLLVALIWIIQWI